MEHTLNPSPHEIEEGCLFKVNDSEMSDGDGAPAKMNDSYKHIPEEVYRKAMKMFHETGNKMDCEAYDANPLNRIINKNDYLYYDGFFFHIVDKFSPDIYKIKSFCYTGYDLSCEEDTDTYMSFIDFLKDFDIEDKCKIQVIDKRIYDKALEIAKTGVREVKDYLGNLYNQNKNGYTKGVREDFSDDNLVR